MFVTGKHIPRRTFLRGTGVTLALPLLDAMVPAGRLLAQTAATPTLRFAGIFVPHGMAPGHHIPDKEGTGFKFPVIHEPLEPFRERVVILNGLHARSAEAPPGGSPADHWVASAFMSAEKPRRTVGTDLYNGTTIDQIIAKKIGTNNLMPSLQLALEDPGANSSNCGEGYSCAYTNSISWVTPTRPLPMELNPQVVFERMFGDGGTAEERVLRRSQNRSLLDSLTNNLARFRGRLGATDRSRLDEYAEDIREIERRLQIAAKASAAAPENVAVPVGVPESFDEHVKLQSDLLALAFRADITRVATMLFARDLTTRSYPESGTTVAFHAGSHHGEDPRRKVVFAQVNRYHISMLAYLTDKLAKTGDGNGTLLDHSLILYGSNMGNSNQHSHEDAPHVLVGGANGKLKGGRHLAYPTRTVPTGNLLLSVLDMFDIHQDAIGDSTGRLDRL
jgi:hypothetical protein